MQLEPFVKHLLHNGLSFPHLTLATRQLSQDSLNFTGFGRYALEDWGGMGVPSMLTGGKEGAGEGGRRRVVVRTLGS